MGWQCNWSFLFGHTYQAYFARAGESLPIYLHSRSPVVFGGILRRTTVNLERLCFLLIHGVYPARNTFVTKYSNICLMISLIRQSAAPLQMLIKHLPRARHHCWCPGILIVWTEWRDVFPGCLHILGLSGWVKDHATKCVCFCLAVRWKIFKRQCQIQFIRFGTQQCKAGFSFPLSLAP